MGGELWPPTRAAHRATTVIIRIRTEDRDPGGSQTLQIDCGWQRGTTKNEVGFSSIIFGITRSVRKRRANQQVLVAVSVHITRVTH